jgi:hypothetical protein
MIQAAILTGDLIASTRAAPLASDGAMAALQSAAQTIRKITGADPRFTRFRGDGWQIYLPGRPFVLRASLILIAALRASGTGLTTRLSVGIGPVDQLGSKDLSDASGPALILSGRNLDNMTNFFNHFTYADPADTEDWPRALLDLALWQARHWTPEQAEAAALALDLPRPGDEALAGSLGISRQAFQSRLRGAGLMALSRALTAFEAEHKAQEP